MKKEFKIAPKNLPNNPFRLAIYGCMVYTMGDYWNISTWIVAPLLFLYGWSFIYSIVMMGFTVLVDVFEESKHDNPALDDLTKKGKSRFQEKLEKLAKERGVNIDSK